MPSIPFKRPLSFLSAFAVAVLTAALVQAQEFKPFLSLQTANPTTLIEIVESLGAVFDPTDSSGMKAELVPYKNMPGVNAAGTIGLAVQVNEESSLFGLDVIVVLPVSDLAALTIPNVDPMQTMMLKAMLGEPVNGKYTFFSPMGNVVAFQKADYIIVATDGAADFAETADPKTLFAGLDEFTLGLTLNLENITKEDVEMIMEMLALPLMMMGITDFDPEDIMENLEERLTDALGAGQMQLLTDTAAFTMGFSIDPRNLNTNLSALQVPRKDSELAKKFLNVKNARTKFAGFLRDTPKTVFAFSYLDYLTDAEIEEFESTAELMSEGFIEGLLESVADDGGGGVAAALFADAFLQWMDDVIEYLDTNRLMDATMSLDSDGVALFAAAFDPALMANLADMLLEHVVPLLGEEAGQMREFIEGKIKADYETASGYSLSGLPDLFADLPEEAGAPDGIENIHLSIYWAAKGNEAVALAVGLGAAKTESALKAALQASATPAAPPHTGVIALKPLGEFLQNQILPLMEAFDADSAAANAQAKEMFAKLAAMDAGVKMLITTEFPDDAFLQKIQIDGKVFDAFRIIMQPAIGAAREAAQRMQCMNHMKQIALALHNYHDTHNALPPLYTVDADGKPLHSWRVLILPYMEQQALYQMIRLDEPWDSPHNRQFHNFPISTYMCPSNTSVAAADGLNCTYSVIAGEGFVPATAAGRNTGLGFGAITDGLSNTIALVEVKQPFNWMDPTADITLDELAKGINKPDGRVGSFHEGGAMNVGMFDGSVRLVGESVDSATLRAMGTRAGGESVRLP